MPNYVNRYRHCSKRLVKSSVSDPDPEPDPLVSSKKICLLDPDPDSGSLVEYRTGNIKARILL